MKEAKIKIKAFYFYQQNIKEGETQKRRKKNLRPKKEDIAIRINGLFR